MEQKAVNKMLAAQEKMRADPIICALREEYRWHESRLQELLKQLPDDQAGILTDYLGILMQLQIKLLEFVAV